MITIEKDALVDAAVGLNLPPSEYFSLWNDLGQWQFDALHQLGLQPQHRLLDVGCGALRFGLHAIDYLDDGHYVGVDAFARYLDLGRRLAKTVVPEKNFRLIESSDFDFGVTTPTYDVAIAQSVLTHLSKAQNESCVAALAGVMKPGSQFVFTYLVGRPQTLGFLYNGVQPMMRPVDTDDAFLATIAERHNAVFEKLDLNHPTGQSVGRFIFR